MEKPIEVIFLKQVEEFANSIGDKPRKKLFHAIRKTKERLFGQWFAKLKSSDGIFEFRVKKSNKTPPAEIRKAEQIRREYFEEKREGKKNKSK